jgi:DNA gyrase subunit A
LADEGLRMSIIKTEMFEMKEKYGDGRKSEIVYAADDFRMEDMIADEDVVITISRLGYIKRTPLTEYKAQNRGGTGAKGSATRDADFLEHMFVASTHNYMLFFTEQGKCYWLRAFEIPEGNKASKGRAIQNMVNIAPNDKVKAYINVKDLTDQEYIKNNYIIMCSQKGTIKKTSLEAYSRPRQNGINAITVKEGDMLLEAHLTSGKDEILIASRKGKLVRFNEEKVRPMGRNASGVRGIRLASEDDEVIGMIAAKSNDTNILVVSENGYGKRSEIEAYRVTNRGAKGVKTLNITEKTGSLIAIKDVTDNDDIMIINKSGLTIRIRVSDLRVMGRATQGVRLIKFKSTDAIAAVAKVETDDEEEAAIIDGEELIDNTPVDDDADDADDGADDAEDNAEENEDNNN